MLGPKVFGIGFHKTGTKSLARALVQLGYRVTGSNDVYNPAIAHEVHGLVDRLLGQYDAFQDNPWPVLYRDLDRRCPGSRFILTVRPPDEWLHSVLNHFGGDSTPMREWIYGVGAPRGSEEIFLRRYERHNREVLEYFRDRPGDLLVLRITEGEGWEKLCPFLGKPVPPVPFPHANSAEERLARDLRRQSSKL
jgi:hypothetical protein